MVPYAHLLSPSEEGDVLLRYLVDSEIASMSHVSVLLEVSYAENGLEDELFCIMNPSNPFTVKLNGVPLLPLIGIGGTFRIVYVLYLMRTWYKA